jgi:hypothetical protein
MTEIAHFSSQDVFLPPLQIVTFIRVTSKTSVPTSQKTNVLHYKHHTLNGVQRNN